MCWEIISGYLTNLYLSYRILRQVSFVLFDFCFRNNTVLVTDARETKAIKSALGIITPTEDGLFVTDLSVSQNTLSQEKSPHVAVFLKPKESVLIPIKYMETRMLQRQMKMDGPQRNVSYFIFRFSMSKHPSNKGMRFASPKCILVTKNRSQQSKILKA